MEDQDKDDLNPDENSDNDDDDDGVNYDDEVTKRGAKNIILENRKKAKELEDLKAELAETKSKIPAPPPPANANQNGEPAYVTEYRKKMTDKGVDPEIVEDNIKLMVNTATDVTRIQASKSSKYLKGTILDNVVSELKADEGYNYFIEKLEPEFRAEMNKVPTEFWEYPEARESALARVIKNNKKKLSGINSQKTDEQIGDLPAESSGVGSRSNANYGGVTGKEVEEYALENGIEITTDETRRKVIASIKAKKDFIKSQQKK